MRRALVVLAVALSACSSAVGAAPSTRVAHPPMTTTFRVEQRAVLACIEAVEGAYLTAEQRWSVDVAGLRSVCGLAGDAYGPGGIGRSQQQAIADIGHLVDALDPHVLPLAVTAAQRDSAFATLQLARGAFDLTGR